MDDRSVKIDTDGMGTLVLFAGHGGSSATAMGAVD